MNIQQIESFIYVALTGSFSKAAEMLFLTQPSLSTRVQSLENELGILLFYRSGKNVTLTEAGKTFFPYAENIITNVQEGKWSLQNLKNNTEGNLQIASVIIAATYLLPGIIKDFRQSYPGVKLSIQTGHSHQVVDMVLNHEVSIGIARSVEHSQIESIPLMSDEMLLVVYANHPFSEKTFVSIEDVANEPLILFNRGSLDWTLIDRIFKHKNLEPNVIMELDNIEAIKEMVKKEVGIAVLSRFSITEELKKNHLYTVTIQEIAKIDRNVDLIFLKGKKLQGITKLFVDFLVDKFSQS
jgi:DNA-binding transcriptional LysR family regulator